MVEELLDRSQRQQTRLRPERVAVKNNVNWQLLIGTVVALVLAAVITHLRYASQQDANVDALMTRAEELKAEDDWHSAADYLFRYAQMRPDDDEAWVDMAVTYAKAASTVPEKERAIELFNQALGRVSGDRRVDLYEGLIDLFLSMRRFGAAERFAKQQHERTTDPLPKALYYRVRALDALDRTAYGDLPVMRAYEYAKAALSETPGDVDIAIATARLCRTRLPSVSDDDWIARADQFVNVAIEAEENDANAEAFLARSLYRRDFNIPGADEDLAKAVELGSDDFAVLLAAGSGAFRKAIAAGADNDSQTASELLKSAVDFFRGAVASDPSHPQGYVGLAQALIRQQRLVEACEVLREGLDHVEVKLRRFELYRVLAVALLGRRNYDEARRVIDTEIEPLVSDYVERYGVSQKHAGFVRGQVDVLRGRLLYAQERSSEAADVLRNFMRRFEPSSPREIRLAVDALLVLAAAESRLNRWPEAANAYQRLLQYRPGDEKTLAGLSEALAKAGVFNRSLEIFSQLVEKRPDSPELWKRVAQVNLSRQLASPVDKRDWRPFQKALDRAKELSPHDWQLPLMEARRARLTTDGQDSVVAALKAVEAVGSSDPVMWESLIFEYEQLGLAEEADRALKSYENLVSSPVVVAVVKSRLLSLRNEHARALNVLSEAGQRAGIDDRPSFLWELVRLCLRAKQHDRANAVLQQLRQQTPNDVGVVTQLIELAFVRDDQGELDRLLTELAQLEGSPEGVYSCYFKARRHLREGTKESLDRGLELQRKVQQLRPDWFPGYALRGDLLTQMGDVDAAIQAYEKAVSLGTDRVSVYEQLVKLLFRQGNLYEADAYLSRLSSLIPAGEVSPEIAGMSVSVAAQLDRLPEALRRANDRARQKPNDPLSLIWFGQMLSISRKTEAAQKVLRRATEVAPEDFRTWNALFAFYVSRDREAAQETLKLLDQKADLPEAKRAFALARGYELLGDFSRSRTLYERSVQLDPEDITARIRLAGLLVNLDIEAAETELREILRIDPESADARRMLAAVRAVRGTAESWDEVGDLLSVAGKDDERARIDRVLHARLLARFGGIKNLDKAVTALEEIAMESEPEANDMLLLALAYERRRDFAAADKQYQRVISRSDVQPMWLASYIGFLMRRSELEKSENELAKLDEITRDKNYQLRFVYIGLYAKWLRLSHRQDEVTSFVEAYAGEAFESAPPDQRVRLVAAIGQLYVTVHQFEAAEPWFRKLFELEPRRYGELAFSLCHLSRHKEAVELCLQHRPETIDGEYLRFVVQLLSTKNAPREAFDAAESVLQEAYEAGQDDAQTLFLIGIVRVLQGRYEDALSCMRQSLDLRPDHVMTLNNIATLLAEVPGRESEALNYIGQAIASEGEVPYLLDTKGVIMIKLGRVDQAIELLNRAVSGLGVDPRYYLHLAVAYEKSDSVVDARKAMDAAIFHGLDASLLTDTDRRWLEELKVKLASEA